jgi:hypothetical protein
LTRQFKYVIFDIIQHLSKNYKIEEAGMTTHKWITAIGLLLVFVGISVAYAAYSHQNETDSANFLAVYPGAKGTKLDSCTTCHRSGSYTQNGKTTTLGSCQYCHAITNYDPKALNFQDTLNPYGMDYLKYGRSEAAIKAIAGLDSDADHYSNAVEIAALRYPGDPNDDPTKVFAPSKVYSLKQIEAMPQHAQFLLLNASKSTDTYAQYSGPTMEHLLKPLVLPSATQVTVVSPDGFSQTHPFANDHTLNVYYVNGTYPAATYFYDAQADVNLNSTGWCDYSSPFAKGRTNGDAIDNPGGLRMILATKRDGAYLAPGILNISNKLDGEGPYRLVPPQTVVGPPDQRSTATSSSDPNKWIWPYQSNGDHNAGFSTRSTTMLRVEPLPPGTTDINLLEAGWNYIDSGNIVVYGAINPLENIKEDLATLLSDVKALPRTSFRKPLEKPFLEAAIAGAKLLVHFGDYRWAYEELNRGVMAKMDGCVNSPQPDANDWLKDCPTQIKLYSAVNEIMVYLKILE